MADKKISELDAITGANTAADDFFIVVDSSGSTTKKISREELNNAIERDVLSTVDIDGGTIDGTVIGATTPAAGDFTTVDTTGDVTIGGNLNVQGTTVTIDSASAQTVDLGDGDKIRLGDADDLQIFHDASHSRIKDSGTGNLIISADNFQLKNAADTKDAIYAASGGAVTLYYDSAPKLATTSNGIDVQGTVNMDGAQIDGVVTINGTGRISSDGSIVYTIDSDSSSTDAGHYFRSDGGTNRFVVSESGDISFYDSTGVSQGLFWDSSTQRLGLGVTSPAAKLHLQGANAASVNKDFIYRPTGDNTNNYQLVNVYNASGASSGSFPNLSTGFSLETSGGFGASTGFVLQTNSASPVIIGTNDTERMRIDSSGNVGIGTVSVDAKLHVAGTQASGDVPYIFENSAQSGVVTSSIVFAGAGGGGAEKARIKSAVYGDGYMSFHTNNDSEKMRIDASGHLIAPYGITLGTAVGTYNADNTLDDYEEGTWDVSLSDDTGVVDAHTTSGRYVKSGSMVFVSAAIYGGSGFTASGDVKINLPFAAGVTQVNMSSPTTYIVDAAGIEAVYIVDGASYCNFSTDITNGNKIANKVSTGAVFGGATKRLYFGIIYSTA